MKFDWKYVLAFGILCLILGMTICQHEDKTIPVEIIDTLIVHEYIHDTSIVVDTVILSKTDTLIITEETPIGRIPVRIKTVTDSLPVLVGSEKIYLPIETVITYRGILYKHTIRTIPGLYNVDIQVRRKFLTFRRFIKVTVDIPIISDSLNSQKELFVGLGGGVKMKERLFIDGAIGLNHRFDIVGKIDFEVNF